MLAAALRVPEPVRTKIPSLVVSGYLSAARAAATSQVTTKPERALLAAQAVGVLAVSLRLPARMAGRNPFLSQAGQSWLLVEPLGQTSARQVRHRFPIWPRTAVVEVVEAMEPMPERVAMAAIMVVAVAVAEAIIMVSAKIPELAATEARESAW